MRIMGSCRPINDKLKNNLYLNAALIQEEKSWLPPACLTSRRVLTVPTEATESCLCLQSDMETDMLITPFCCLPLVR